VTEPAGGGVVRRALLSVSEKTGIVAFAHGLAAGGVEILSTGGTAALLRAEGIAVRAVEEVTGFPEMLDGRVRTLHPKIHGGILADRANAAHLETLARHAIDTIDLVAVTFYPFERVFAERLAADEATELIDIGGPCLLRAAAKNAGQVAPVCRRERYGAILAEMEESGGRISAATRAALRREAFAATARYDAAIARFLGREEGGAIPDPFALVLAGAEPLRYGENPHQAAALFAPPAGDRDAPYRVLGGKALSFNNLVDLDTAARAAQPVEAPCAVVVKHANPCGVAVGRTADEAYRRARAADPVSAFGGIAALNRPVDGACADALAETFLEAVVAPAVSPEATARLAAKKSLRIVEVPALADPRAPLPPAHEVRATLFGVLVQDADAPDPAGEWRLATGAPPRDDLLADARLAWHVARFVKSNAIVLVREGRTIGVGAGQTSRVDSVRLAIRKARDAGFDPAGAALASDAFFPFADGVEEACAAGVRLIVQPGGSVRDEEVVRAAASAGATMLLTGRRHFRH
jgi:phosphoribosylaminoimidazolecarboxamide formyltransferase/IMP cyclohydrolase